MIQVLQPGAVPSDRADVVLVDADLQLLDDTIAIATDDYENVAGHAGKARHWLLYLLHGHTPQQLLPAPTLIKLAPGAKTGAQLILDERESSPW